MGEAKKKTWFDAMHDIAVGSNKKEQTPDEKEKELVEKVSDRVIEKLEGNSNNEDSNSEDSNNEDSNNEDNENKEE